MPSPTATLERAAIDTHRRGQSWGDFWQAHGGAVCAAEPFDRGRFRRLVAKLLALVCSGNTGGLRTLGNDDAAPWQADDAPAPDDSRTAARCQIPLRPLPARRPA